MGFDTDGTYVATFDRQTRFLYDRAGNRVVRIVADAAGITRTVYAGDCYEHTSDGASSETTKYYTLGGRRVGLLRLRAKPPLRFLRGLSPTARLPLGQVRSRRLGFTQTGADDSESPLSPDCFPSGTASRSFSRLFSARNSTMICCCVSMSAISSARLAVSSFPFVMPLS